MLQSKKRIYFPSTVVLRGKDFGLVEDATNPAFIGCSVTNGKAMSNNDTPLHLSSPGLDSTRHLDSPIAVDSQEQAWQRLITRAVPLDELPSLIETMFSGRETNVVNRLKGGDAQASIDIIDEVPYRIRFFRGNVDLLLFLLRSFAQAVNGLDLTPRTRKKCVKLLYKMCARHALFPTSLRIELCDNPTNIVLFQGGFGDVSKREYQGREVAVKRLRIYDTSDLQNVIRVCS